MAFFTERAPRWQQIPFQLRIEGPFNHNLRAMACAKEEPEPIRRKLLQKVHFNWFAKECLYRNARQGCVGVRTCYMIRLWCFKGKGEDDGERLLHKHLAFNWGRCGDQVAVLGIFSFSFGLDFKMFLRLIQLEISRNFSSCEVKILLNKILKFW